MNIGIFTDTYYPQINGVVTSIRTLKKELEKNGHKIFIFTTTDPNMKTKQPNVFRLPSMPFIFLPAFRVNYMYSPKLLLFIKKFKLDIIHTQTEFPLGIFGKVIADFLRIPHVHTYHTMYEDYVHYIAKGHVITPKMAKKFSRFFCNSSDSVIAPARKTKLSLIDYGVRKSISVIPTGIDFAPFTSNYSKEELDETRNELGLSPEDSVIVYVGRVAKEKSIDVLIKAMPEVVANIKNAKLVIVGNGPLITELSNLSERLDVKKSIIFAGSKPWSEIGRYYKIGDVFSTASTSETQGLTYLEAIATGVPIVIKKDPSIEDFITNNENGFVFEKDTDAGNLLCEALINKENSKEVAEKAFKSIQWLSSENFAKNMELLYIDALSNYAYHSRPLHIKIPKIPIKLNIIRKKPQLKILSLKKKFSSKK